jgi:hypothetical protein
MHEIQTKRLILRPFRETDYDDLYEFLSQLREDAFEGYPGITYENGRKHLDERLGSEEYWAMELRETGKVIGNIYCGKRDYEARELGYRQQGRAAAGLCFGCPPRTPLGHGLESFTLDKVPFRYGMTDCFGYQTVKFNGGVITGNGQHLRIAYTNYSYLGNVIVCIEELP